MILCHKLTFKSRFRSKVQFPRLLSFLWTSKSFKLLNQSLHRSVRFIQFSQSSQHSTQTERGHARPRRDHAPKVVAVRDDRKQNDRQRSLPEHLRERGVAVIRPKGQNGCWVRGRWEEWVEHREEEEPSRKQASERGRVRSKRGGVSRRGYAEFIGWGLLVKGSGRAHSKLTNVQHWCISTALLWLS